MPGLDAATSPNSVSFREHKNAKNQRPKNTRAYSTGPVSGVSLLFGLTTTREVIGPCRHVFTWATAGAKDPSIAGFLLKKKKEINRRLA